MKRVVQFSEKSSAKRRRKGRGRGKKEKEGVKNRVDERREE